MLQDGWSNFTRVPLLFKGYETRLLVVMDRLMGRRIKHYSLMMNLPKHCIIPNGLVFFLESVKGQMLLMNKVQWLDLAFPLWPPLVGLPLAKMVQVHYDFMVKYSKL